VCRYAGITKVKGARVDSEYRQGDIVDKIHILRGFLIRILGIWLFLFIPIMLDIIGIISDIIFPEVHFTISIYIIPIVIGLLLASMKLYVEDQIEIEKYRAQDGVPKPALLALESDRQVYERLRNAMKLGDTETALREEQFCGSFDTRGLAGMREFLRLGRTPDAKFLDRELESLRGSIESDMQELHRIISTYTSPTSSDVHFNRVHDPYSGVFNHDFSTPDADRSHREAMEKGEKMNQLATSICESYDKLILQCRMKLGV
jgi:hypothetical protein